MRRTTKASAEHVRFTQRCFPGKRAVAADTAYAEPVERSILPTSRATRTRPRAGNHRCSSPRRAARQRASRTPSGRHPYGCSLLPPSAGTCSSLPSWPSWAAPHACDPAHPRRLRVGREREQVAGRDPHADARRPVLGRLDARGRGRHPDSRRRVAPPVRAAPSLAARGVHAVRDLHRVGRVSRDVSRGPSRPAHVHRLETLPVNASYPSGHTAASVALFGGLLLVLASRVESLALRIMLWSLVIVIPAFVIWARLLRGMHHVTDTAAGVILGILALCITVFAARRLVPPPRAATASRRRERNGDASRGDRPCGQVDRRRPGGAPYDPAPRRRRRAVLVGGAEEQVRRRARRAGARGRRRLVFVWGGDGMVQRSIDAPPARRDPRDRPPGRRTSSPRASASRRTSARPSRSASTAATESWMSAGSTASASRSWPAPG